MIVCAIPELGTELMLVIAIPTPSSFVNLPKVSFVILFLTSLTTTLPIRSGTANETASSGSATGVSLLTWGYNSFTGWEKLSPVNGDTVGLLEAFNKVR